jgi:trehalose 2-sulfotransferase
VTVIANNGARQPELSCFIATTPWSGSGGLCRALEESGLAGHPRHYFDPLEVVPRSVRYKLLGWGKDHLPRQPEREFAARYLNGVTEAAMGPNGVLSVHLPWSHQRWLTRFTRAAAPDVAGEPTRSDHEIIQAWFPRSRYVYLTSADTVRQAGRWYLARRIGPVTPGPAARDGAAHSGQPADLAKVRWIEALIFRQEHGWESWFQVNAIDAHRIRYEDFLADPEETVNGVLQWLGLPGSPAQRRGEPRRPRQPGPAGGWLEDYAAARPLLSPTIGVYQGQE